MRTIFIIVLFLLASCAFADAYKDGVTLHGTWVLQSDQCLDPAGPRHLRPDASGRWIFEDGVYQQHFDASEDGRYPRCRDLYERGLYRVESSGDSFKLAFSPIDASVCKIEVNGIRGEQGNPAEKLHQSFEISTGPDGPELFEDFDSSFSCHRIRFIFVPGPTS